MGVVFIGSALALTELNGRFLHNHGFDPGSDYRRLLASIPATQRYKGHLCPIRAHEIANYYGGCLYRWYPSAQRPRWRIPTQQLLRSWI